MQNNTAKQFVISDGKFNPNQTSERVLLVNPDGSPYSGSASIVDGSRNRPVVSILDHGASLSSPDNQGAINAAILDAVTKKLPLYIPPGTWNVGKSPDGAFCLRLRTGLEIFGEGSKSVLKQIDFSAGGMTFAYTRLFGPVSSSPVTDVYIHDITLDGNSQANEGYNIFPVGHASAGLEINARTGIFLHNVQRCLIERVEFRFFTGHAVSCYHQTTDVRVDDCWIHDMTSNGLTVTGGAKQLWFTNNLIENTRYTGIDFEPYISPEEIFILNNIIKAPTNPGSKAMSIGGNTGGIQLRSARIIGNRCFAPINLIWGTDIDFSHNHVTVASNDTNTYGLQIFRAMEDVRVIDNTFEGGASLGTAMIGVIASSGEQPNNIQIRGNALLDLSKDAVYVAGAKNILIADNGITFTTPAVGLNLRATFDIDTIRAHNNRIRNASAPVIVARTGSLIIGDLNIHDNIFEDAGNTITNGIEFSTTSAFVNRAQLSRNHFGPNITNRYRRLSAVTSLLDAERLEYALSDETTGLTTGTKLTVRAPFRYHTSKVTASTRTPSTSGVITINKLVNGVSIFTTKLTIDQGATTSTTATVPQVITNNNVPLDAIVEFVIDTAGVNATGLKVSVECLRA